MQALGVTTGRTFYATEMYIMHFLEPAQFLNAPDLAGRKVNVLYNPGLDFIPLLIRAIVIFGTN